MTWQDSSLQVLRGLGRCGLGREATTLRVPEGEGAAGIWVVEGVGHFRGWLGLDEGCSVVGAWGG